MSKEQQNNGKPNNRTTESRTVEMVRRESVIVTEENATILRDWMQKKADECKEMKDKYGVDCCFGAAFETADEMVEGIVCFQGGEEFAVKLCTEIIDAVK